MKQQQTGHELIEQKASDIMQKVSEVTGTLQTIDYYIEDIPDSIPEHIMWTIRHTYRTLESVIGDASAINDTSEELRRSGSTRGAANVQ